MTTNTVPASAPALPSATILAFPPGPDLHMTVDTWKRVYLTCEVSDQFSGLDDAGLDKAIHDMIETSAEGVERMVRDNGEALKDLRRVVAFLAAIDLRIGASAGRVLSKGGC